jgi:hypothetical protein
MKKIYLLIAAVGVLIACDPVHEKIDNGIDNSNHITVEELRAMSTVIVDKVNQVSGQKTYTATQDTPVTLIENIDVTNCEGVTVYFDPETIADTCWRISVAGGSEEKILKKASFFRYTVPDGATNVSNIVMKHVIDKNSAETNNITIKAIYKTYGPKVAPGLEGEFGNVITCQTSAPVNAKWDFAGKEKIGNFASNKMKVNWNESGDYIPTKYTIRLTALCADGTMLVTDFPVECDKISNPLVKYYIYGDPNRDPSEEPQPPFQPGYWSGGDMRFSSTEGAHFPTISDEVYYGLKTLIVDASEAEGSVIQARNGWWSSTYYEAITFHDGANEIQITQQMADECAKGGEGRDLLLILTGGPQPTINSVYYEE